MVSGFVHEEVYVQVKPPEDGVVVAGSSPQVFTLALLSEAIAALAAACTEHGVDAGHCGFMVSLKSAVATRAASRAAPDSLSLSAQAWPKSMMPMSITIRNGRASANSSSSVPFSLRAARQNAARPAIRILKRCFKA